MLKAASRAGNLAPYLVATSQNVPSSIRPIIPAIPLNSEKLNLPTPSVQLTNYSLSRSIVSGKVTASCGIGVPSQVRYAHTDIQIPDFTPYRKDAVKDSSAPSGPSASARRAFTYLIAGGGSVMGAYTAKTVVQEFVQSMSASADVLAMAQVEIKLSDVPEGKSVTFKWRGKPLFVRHRTSEEIEREAAVDLSTLRHQEHDKDRAEKLEYLVVIGVCTHLGCVPVADAGDFGGYYCPCHGSHYDASGRIRKGPAPLNLEVPTYFYKDEETLVVG